MQERVISQIIQYYREAEGAYRNWGRDEEREGIYALHGGFAIEEEALSHYEEVKELTRQLIRFTEIPQNSLVLDAGCGTGALTFELAERYPTVKVIGINISPNQVDSAKSYLLVSGIGNACFSLQDYHQLAFPSGLFDRVIFCESYIHSYDKRRLMEEVYRVLRQGGKVVLSDMFLEREPENKEEELFLADIQSGWVIPNILKPGQLRKIWEELNFGSISFVNHTQRIVPSSRRMREHAELRLTQGNPGSEVIQLSRRAPIACNKAIEVGLIGYYFAKATKIY